MFPGRSHHNTTDSWLTLWERGPFLDWEKHSTFMFYIARIIDYTLQTPSGLKRCELNRSVTPDCIR